MAKHNVTDDANRLKGLQDAGRVSADEAAKLQEAMRSQAERATRNDPATEVDLGKMSSFDRRFLSGQINEEALNRHVRKTFWIGLLFASTPWTAYHCAQRGEFDPWALVTGIIFGVLTSTAIHLTLMRPWREKLIRLRREAGVLRPVATADEHQCPTCLGEEFTVYGSKHWSMHHWRLNPGIAINELLLGQRIPRIMRICVACGGQSYPCNHCKQSINLMHWSRGRAFGNWSGLRCPNCDSDIPTMCNIFARPFRSLARRLASRRSSEQTP